MKRLLDIVVVMAGVLTLSAFSPRRAVAQDEDPSVQIPDLPKLFFDAVSFQSDQPALSRLDVYVDVPFDAMRFSRVEDLFTTTYDVTIDVLDSAGALVTEKFWTEKVETKDYDQSVSSQSGKLSQKSFPLSPGTYFVRVQISDQETKKTTTDKRKVVVRDFSGPAFSMSDIMLVNRLSEEAGKKVIYPNISGDVAELANGFYLFFETYEQIGAHSELVIARVRNHKGDIVRSDSSMQSLGSAKKSTFVKINSTQLFAGDYTVDVQTSPVGPHLNSTAREMIASASRSFIIHWRGLPVSIVDLDLAIDQAQYVTEKEKIDEMKKAPVEKKREMFREFWKKKDPTPNTERNELMEEYYGRVAYANKHFSHYVDGWKTDMGMVYIIFGTPSNIERHPFDIDAKPYEVWTYYDLNREFVFVDASGFGDYRLQSPIWDLWRTRPR